MPFGKRKHTKKDQRKNGNSSQIRGISFFLWKCKNLSQLLINWMCLNIIINEFGTWNIKEGIDWICKKKKYTRKKTRSRWREKWWRKKEKKSLKAGIKKKRKMKKMKTSSTSNHFLSVKYYVEFLLQYIKIISYFCMSLQCSGFGNVCRSPESA